MTPLEQQLQEALTQAKMKNNSLLRTAEQLESEYKSSISTITEEYKNTIAKQQESFSQILKQQQSEHISQLNDIVNSNKKNNQILLEELEKLQNKLQELERADIAIKEQLQTLQSNIN